MRPSSASSAAAAAALLAGVVDVYGCSCKYTIAKPAGTRWSATSGASKQASATTVEECEQACCADSDPLGCLAFTFNAVGVKGEECVLYSEVPSSTVWSSGWTSGKLSGNDCGDAKAVEASWIFVVVFLFSMSVYFVGGVVVKKQQGRSVPGDWLPNHQFWASLYGLVIDGVGLVARGGKPAGYAEISAAVDAMAKEKATSGTAEQEVEDPTPAKRQATRSAPTSLHSAATVGDIKKLERVLKANGCPQIDAGDSRRYTAFHVACAAGHLDCARLLRNAGCDTELTNDVGLTAWELAEQLKRMEIIALKSEPVTPFETSSAEKLKQKQTQHKPAKARSESSSRKASSAAAATDVSAGLEESKMLKQELKARGLSTKGSKADLKARLAESKSSVL